MDLYKELLCEIMNREDMDIAVTFPHLDVNKLVEDKCYTALKNIKAILEDSTLADAECYRKIEEIICLFEELGCSIEHRHSFNR